MGKYYWAIKCLWIYCSRKSLVWKSFLTHPVSLKTVAEIDAILHKRPANRSDFVAEADSVSHSPSDFYSH